MLHTYTDSNGRLVVRAWHETPIGKLAITIGTVVLLALCLLWAADVMPVVLNSRPNITLDGGAR